jgi:hypothetical protein
VEREIYKNNLKYTNNNVESIVMDHDTLDSIKCTPGGEGGKG